MEGDASTKNRRPGYSPRFRVLRRGVAVVGICALAFLQVVFLGQNAWAADPTPPNGGQLSFSAQGLHFDSTNGRIDGMDSFSWSRTSGSGTAVQVYVGCTTSAANVTIARAAATTTTSLTGVATYTQQIVASGGITGAYTYSGTLTHLCSGANSYFIGIQGWLSVSARTWWWPDESDAGSRDCGTGILANVRVWETSSGLGFAFSWTGSAAWTKWRIHKAGDKFTTWGSLNGFVSQGISTGYWRSDNDPPTTSVFNAGDTVRLRLYSTTTANSPTSCWVEVVAGSVPYDWSGEGGGSGGGPTDYGSATDPDTATSCSGFDIFCRIKAAMAWAFVPDAVAMEGWSSRVASITAAPPMSIVIAGGGYAQQISLLMGCVINPGCSTFTTGTLPVMTVAGYDFDLTADFTEGHNFEAFEIVYSVLTFACWIALVWWSFRRVARSFGSKEDDA